MISTILGMVQRYAGKKFATLLIVLGAIAWILDSFLNLDAPSRETCWVYVATLASVGFLGGLTSLGIGIADHGKGAKNGNA